MDIQVIIILIEILRIKKDFIGVTLHTSLLISILCSHPEPEILSEILVSFSSIQAYSNIQNFIGNILKKDIITYDLHYSLLSIVERMLKMDQNLSIELQDLISKSFIQFFIKCLTEKKGLFLCESILTDENIFSEFLQHVPKSESFLDIMIEVCKFTKVKFTKEFFNLSKEINVNFFILLIIEIFKQ